MCAPPATSVACARLDVRPLSLKASISTHAHAELKCTLTAPTLYEIHSASLHDSHRLHKRVILRLPHVARPIVHLRRRRSEVLMHASGGAHHLMRWRPVVLPLRSHHSHPLRHTPQLRLHLGWAPRRGHVPPPTCIRIVEIGVPFIPHTSAWGGAELPSQVPAPLLWGGVAGGMVLGRGIEAGGGQDGPLLRGALVSELCPPSEP